MQDLRLAARGMRRDVGFTAFVVLIAGLGIGASATVFSVVNALLLRPLPFRDAAQLVWISNDGQNHEEWTTQVGHFVDLRHAATSFTDLAGWSNFYHPGDSELTGLGEPERLTSVPVTTSLFALLGVQPAFGRFFTPDETARPLGAPPAVILGHGYWVRRFGADPGIVGRTLMLNNAPALVVGILPASFDFSSVFTPSVSADVFVPWPLTDQTNRRGNTMRIVGRLRSGVTAAQAQAELTGLAPAIERLHPERNGIRPVVVSLATRVSGSIRPALMVLAGAVALVMLIVCANLANLQLARLGARQKEMAVRVALGAGRLRLLRQLLTESLVLAGVGAVLGIALAMVGTARTGASHRAEAAAAQLHSRRRQGRHLHSGHCAAGGRAVRRAARVSRSSDRHWRRTEGRDSRIDPRQPGVGQERAGHRRGRAGMPAAGRDRPAHEKPVARAGRGPGIRAVARRSAPRGS